MMKNLVASFLLIFCFSPNASSQELMVTDDIDHFISAYEKISTTEDTTLQKKYLRELFLDQATPGLQSLREVRHYTEQDYLRALHAYPRFWKSIIPKLNDCRQMFPEIESEIAKLKDVFPSLRPATIYFTIGAFRSGGTIKDNQVLIGLELSLLDDSVDLSELPNFTQKFAQDFQPKKNLALTIVHEYIHTQQKRPLDNLLSYCIHEGIAEYVSCMATDKPSNTPAIQFGQNNQALVFKKFEDDIFSGNIYQWLWGENDNELKVRDLGYYIGYAICEKHYLSAEDKSRALEELISLDYSNLKDVKNIVDGTNLLSKSLKKLEQEYQKSRPELSSYKLNGKSFGKVIPGIVQLELFFSDTMDTTTRGFDYGPDGPANTFKFVRSLGWNESQTAFSCEIEVEATQSYSTWVTSGFRSSRGIRMKSKLVEFKTKSK